MKVKTCALCGLGIGVGLSITALVSMGAGHGTYRPLHLFFAPLAALDPFPVLLAGVLLYGLYGFLLSIAARRAYGWPALALLVVFHYATYAFARRVDSEDPVYISRTWAAMPEYLIAGGCIFFGAHVLAIAYVIRNRRKAPHR